jgi:hypothetical protein
MTAGWAARIRLDVRIASKPALLAHRHDRELLGQSLQLPAIANRWMIFILRCLRKAYAQTVNELERAGNQSQAFAAHAPRVVCAQHGSRI